MKLDGPVVVLGAGAIGGTTGGALLRAGRDVVLVDHWYQNVETIRRDGLTVEAPGESYTVKARALHPDEIRLLDDPPSIILLCCKSYDTEMLVRMIEPYMPPHAVIVSLQNGINEDVIAEVVGPRRTVGCVVHYTAAMFEPAIALRYAARDRLSYTLGTVDGGGTSDVSGVAAVLGDAGRVKVTEDIWPPLWGKLALNSMSNALTALTGLTNSQLWGSEAGVRVMVRLAAEAVRVCRAQGRSMAPIELYASGHVLEADLLLGAGSGDLEALRVASERLGEEAAARSGKGENVSSMLQDIGRGRRTEVDYLNGYVARESRSRGILTPANDSVVDAMRAMEAGELQQSPDVIESLID